MCVAFCAQQRNAPHLGWETAGLYGVAGTTLAAKQQENISPPPIWHSHSCRDARLVWFVEMVCWLSFEQVPLCCMCIMTNGQRPAVKAASEALSNVILFVDRPICRRQFMCTIGIAFLVPPWHLGPLHLIRLLPRTALKHHSSSEQGRMDEGAHCRAGQALHVRTRSIIQAPYKHTSCMRCQLMPSRSWLSVLQRRWSHPLAAAMRPCSQGMKGMNCIWVANHMLCQTTRVCYTR